MGIGVDRCQTVSQTWGAKLMAVADINEASAKEIAGKYKIDYYLDYYKMFSRDDIQVIYVVTPSGKHVITTKPMEVTLEKADDMIKGC